MTSTAVAIRRLDSLTGIRAFAAFLVFWHHANEWYWHGLSSGMVGVSLFYLVSGFVMAWVDRESDTASLFYRRRFARIYPSYLVACLLAFAFLAVRGNFELTDLSALTLMQAWIPIPEIYFAGNAVFWSLSCEAFFYLMFPAIRALTRRLSDRQLVALGVGAILVSFSIATVGSMFPPSALVQWAVVVFPPSRLPEFVLGVVIGTLISRGWRPRIPLLLAAAVSVISVVAAMFVPYAFSRYAVTLIPFAALVAALAASDLSGRRTITQWGPIVKLGIWSYCFYLLHAMVMHTTVAATSRIGIPDYLGAVVALATATVAAWALHRLVERPAERWLRPAGTKRLDDD